MKKRTLVLDTSAFISGFDPNSFNNEQYSVPIVRKELVQNSLPWIRFNTAVDNEKMKVVAPGTYFFNRAKKASEKVGDSILLSEGDLQVLALSLELKSLGHDPLIVSDDYSIQNVADQMGIKFTALVTFGIRLRLHWSRYCPACYRKFPSNYGSKSCTVCGTKLKRKAMKKTPLKKRNARLRKDTKKLF